MAAAAIKTPATQIVKETVKEVAEESVKTVEKKIVETTAHHLRPKYINESESFEFFSSFKRAYGKAEEGQA